MPPAPTAALRAFFGRAGALQQAHPGYEFRPGQIEMAEAVAAALEDRQHLLVEAGTGTGKTLAYLLPVLFSGRRVLLSTGTRNLQEQLVAKDIPLLAAAVGRELSVVTMKGRQNYACKQKILDLEAQPALLELDDLQHYRRIREWIAASETGDQAELESLPENHPLWMRLNARRETCSGSKCPLFDQCFLTKLRQRAAEAELVVVNHHLFFADLMLKRQDLAGVLPPYEAVVFDEAHELESIAGQYFGVSLSSHQIEDLARDAARALPSEADLAPRIEHLRLAAQAFFVRVGAKEGRVPFEDRPQFVAENQEACDSLTAALDHLHSGLDTLREKPEAVHTLLGRLAETRAKLGYLLESEEEGVVYWVERRGRGVQLQATPIAVADLLRDLLFVPTDTVVLTSATLAVDGGFDFIRGRLGLDHARERIVASPYDYRRQALLYLPAHLPAPNAHGFDQAAEDEIEAILTASQGRAFVLCTSRLQMRRLHQSLSARLPFPLLVQDSAPRHLLLERFRSTPQAVLFATSSFWQGVDVQGEQLSCVIIDRLPFASPGDPVVAARVRDLQRQGRNAFTEFQIPEAVLALKQGFGRLIRAASDRGVLALLDTRILNKSYGRHFLRSLPEFACTTQLGAVQSFFREGEMPDLLSFTGPGYGTEVEGEVVIQRAAR